MSWHSIITIAARGSLLKCKTDLATPAFKILPFYFKEKCKLVNTRMPKFVPLPASLSRLQPHRTHFVFHSNVPYFFFHPDLCLCCFLSLESLFPPSQQVSFSFWNQKSWRLCRLSLPEPMSKDRDWIFMCSLFRWLEIWEDGELCTLKHHLPFPFKPAFFIRRKWCR